MYVLYGLQNKQDYFPTAIIDWYS